MVNFTDDQIEIMDYLIEQVENPEGHNCIVSGSGGTGKTTIICELIVRILKKGYSVAVAAMTGKATGVLRSKIRQVLFEYDYRPEKGKLKIETIQKITKESKVTGMSPDGNTLYSNKWKQPHLFEYDVLFVDELSMVPHFVSHWWQMANTRVFGFGDECQIPEVITNETKREIGTFQKDLKVQKIEFVSKYGVRVLTEMAHKQLHTVLRSDNEIALLCNELRDFSQTKMQIVKRLEGWAERTDNIQYTTKEKDIEVTDDWQIICYTNKMCQKINQHLCKRKEYPTLEDKIILFDNLNPLGKYNGDTMTFKEFLDSIESYNKTHKKKLYVCMKWQGKMPNKLSPFEAEQGFFKNYVSYKQEMQSISRERMLILKAIIRDSRRAEGLIKDWLNDIDILKQSYPNDEECFQKILDKLYDADRDMALEVIDRVPPVPNLYVVNCDFGYAITTHKSQGSEYEKVCYLLERFDKPLLYTGISRAKKKVKVINLTNYS